MVHCRLKIPCNVTVYWHAEVTQGSRSPGASASIHIRSCCRHPIRRYLEVLSIRGIRNEEEKVKTGIYLVYICIYKGIVTG